MGEADESDGGAVVRRLTWGRICLNHCQRQALHTADSDPGPHIVGLHAARLQAAILPPNWS